jgi:hypothetical protein
MKKGSKRRVWTDGEIKSIFSLKAQKKSNLAIGEIMGTSNWTVAQILRRKMHADVHIDQNVLDAVATSRALARPKRALKSKDVNPVMAQAALKAEPKDMRRSLPTLDELITPTPEYVGRSVPEATPPVPKTTKADALMDVLACVKRGNTQRQRVAELRAEAKALEDVAKRTEDSTFVKLTALHERGFGQEFLNSLLTESGLCTEGRFNIE